MMYSSYLIVKSYQNWNEECDLDVLTVQKEYMDNNEQLFCAVWDLQIAPNKTLAFKLQEDISD